MKFKSIILTLSVITYSNVEAQLVDSTWLDIIENTSIDKYYQELYNSQNGEITKLKNTGYIPYQRLKSYYASRINAYGEINDIERVKLHMELLERQEQIRSGIPVANWESIGPQVLEYYAGRLISHAFDPFNKDKIWVGSASGGLWLTENSGESWSPKTDQIPSTGVGAIAIHPTNSQTMLIGTGEGFSPTGFAIKPGSGIYKSLDGGDTWLPTSLNYNLLSGISIMDLSWDKENPNIVWAASTNGLYKSVDQGNQWSLVLGDGTNHQNYIINQVIVDASNSKLIYIAIEGKGIFRSENQGLSFDLLNNGLPTTDLNIISLSQCNSQPKVLYTSMVNATNFGLKGVYKTINGGDSWTQINGVPNAHCSPQAIGSCQGWYNNFIKVSPYNPDHIFYGGVTMWESKNSGHTWNQRDRLTCLNCHIPPACKTYVDHHDFGFSPIDSNMVISLNDGGIAISYDGGSCFENSNTGLITSQFYAIASSRINPSIIIGGFQDHGLQEVNLDVGLEWDKWGYFDGSDVEVHSNNENIFYGTWFDGTYWKITENQILASQINSNMNLAENSGTYFAPLAIHPSNGETLLGATQSRLYKTTNGGLNWVPKLTASVISDIRFSEADPNYAYAAAWTNVWSFYRSEDAGETWTQTLGAPGWRVTDIKTSALDPLTLFATRNSINPNTPHIYKSTDGGESWIPIQGDMPDIKTNALAVDFENDDIIYCATDLGVFITENGGQNWTAFNQGMPITFVNDIEFNPTDRSIIVGTLGRGAWKTIAYELNTNSTVNSSNEMLDIQVNPNPISNRFLLKISNNHSSNLKVVLNNRLGMRIKDLFTGKVQDSFSQEFDLSQLNLNPDIYFIQVFYNNRSYIKKVIKQ